MSELSTAVSAGQANVVKAESWLKAHERLIIVVLSIAAALFIGDKILTNQATHDKAISDAAVQQLADQKTENAAILAQVKQTTDQYQVLVTQLTQQNAQLAANVQTRTVVLQQQVKADAALPLPDLGNRWAQLANIKPSDMSASTAGITMTPLGALQTVQALEQVPVLTANLADTVTQKENLSKELASSDNLKSQLITQVAGLQTTVVEQDKTCKAQLTTAKAEARKGKLKAFLYGAGVGVGVTLGFVIHAIL
jgi:hypothetical protein